MLTQNFYVPLATQSGHYLEMKINRHSTSRIILAFLFAFIGVGIIGTGRLPIALGGDDFFFEEHKNIVGGFFLLLAIFTTYRALVKY